MFPDPSSSLGNQIFNPNNFQDYTNVMGIQRPPSNNAMQNIFRQLKNLFNILIFSNSQPMGPTGYRTSGFSGLINQQTRQNGLPSFPVRLMRPGTVQLILISSKCKALESRPLHRQDQRRTSSLPMLVDSSKCIRMHSGSSHKFYSSENETDRRVSLHHTIKIDTRQKTST